VARPPSASRRVASFARDVKLMCAARGNVARPPSASRRVASFARGARLMCAATGKCGEAAFGLAEGGLLCQGGEAYVCGHGPHTQDVRKKTP